MPNTMLNPIYNNAMLYLPLCSSPMFSNEKAEKVVNPPQRPVARNSFQLFEKLSSLILRANTTPMMKLPIMFTLKVAIGKCLLLNNKPVAYLNTEPAAPPNPISKKSLTIFYKFPENVYLRSISHLPSIRTTFNGVLSVML